MAYKGGLGRGLDAIIPTSNEPKSGTDSIPIDSIIPNPRQPRTIMAEEGLQELAEFDPPAWHFAAADRHQRSG